jgi:hypothetical protein
MPPCLPAPPLRVQVPTRTTHTTTEALAQASQLEGCCPVHARNLTRKCTETRHRLLTPLTPNVDTSPCLLGVQGEMCEPHAQRVRCAHTLIRRQVYQQRLTGLCSELRRLKDGGGHIDRRGALEILLDHSRLANCGTIHHDVHLQTCRDVSIPSTSALQP